MDASQELTDQQLARISFPRYPREELDTYARYYPVGAPKLVAPRGFSKLEPWVGFTERAGEVCTRLDNSRLKLFSLCTSKVLEICSPDSVSEAVVWWFFRHANQLADSLGCKFKYLSDGGVGGGRSLSQCQFVILDRGQEQNIKALSRRVFGTGLSKNHLQWDVGLHATFEEAFRDPKLHDMQAGMVQELFGDMIINEARYGFVTNFTNTVFFRCGKTDPMVLEYSPLVRAEDAPLQKFLYVLLSAEEEADASKRLMSRLVLGKAADQLHRGFLGLTDESQLAEAPVFAFSQLGFTDELLEFGRYGLVLHGEVSRQKVAIKTFDLRVADAARAFLNELNAYVKLEELQGVYIPRLICSGRLAQTNVMFVALSYEGKASIVMEKLKSRDESDKVKKDILIALDRIHEKGVLVCNQPDGFHIGDIVWEGRPKFVGFGDSETHEVSESELREEYEAVDRILDEESLTEMETE